MGDSVRAASFDMQTALIPASIPPDIYTTDHALSPEEVRRLYQEPFIPYDPPLEPTSLQIGPPIPEAPVPDNSIIGRVRRFVNPSRRNWDRSIPDHV
jgi:hypothetical protein